MDNKLFKAYIRVIVEEEVKRVLPELLAEAVSEVRTLKENTTPRTSAAPKAKPSRAQLAEMLGLERLGEDTIVARGNVMPTPPGVSDDNPALKAINKDYSGVMKAMGLGK
jgi:hypothetical protein